MFKLTAEQIQEITMRFEDMEKARARWENAKLELKANPTDRAAQHHEMARQIGYNVAAEPFFSRAPEWIAALLEHVKTLEAEIARLSSANNEEGAA